MPQVRLAGVVRELVAGAQRVDDDDREVGREEREVVVAAVPEDHVGLRLGAGEDLAVVDAGVDDHPQLDGKLVLLALLDRRVRRVDVLERREPLDAHRARGRRTASDAGRARRAGPRRAGACRRTGSSGSCRSRCAPRSRRRPASWRASIVERGPSRRKSAPAASTIDALCMTSSCERSEYASTTSSTACARISSASRLLGDDRDAVRIERPGERGRVAAVVDARDLRGGERDDTRLRVLAEDDVEVVEVAAAGSHHDDVPHGTASDPRCP